MGRANSKKVKDYLRVSEYKTKLQNQKQNEQHAEAQSIQNEFGIYHDRFLVVGEDVNLMTSDEIIYYLGITFNGVELSAVPETAIKGLVLNNNLTYQFSTVNS